MYQEDEIVIEQLPQENEIIIPLPKKRPKRKNINKVSYEEIEDELFEILEYTLNEPKITSQSRQKRKKNKTNNLKPQIDKLEYRNYQNKWLLQDGKKEYKNEYGQTCVKYVCTFKNPDGSFCGKDSFIKKDDISHKQFCKYHRKNKSN